MKEDKEIKKIKERLKRESKPSKYVEKTIEDRAKEYLKSKFPRPEFNDNSTLHQLQFPEQTVISCILDFHKQELSNLDTNSDNVSNLGNRCECHEYDPVDVKLCSNCDGYCE